MSDGMDGKMEESSWENHRKVQVATDQYLAVLESITGKAERCYVDEEGRKVVVGAPHGNRVGESTSSSASEVVLDRNGFRDQSGLAASLPAPGEDPSCLLDNWDTLTLDGMEGKTSRVTNYQIGEEYELEVYKDLELRKTEKEDGSLEAVTRERVMVRRKGGVQRKEKEEKKAKIERENYVVDVRISSIPGEEKGKEPEKKAEIWIEPLPDHLYVNDRKTRLED